MGCDIHGYLEVKENGFWKMVEKIPDNRNYDAFGILAGVRNYAKSLPIAEPRGLPIDASEESIQDSRGWEGDGHSHSWLNLRDFFEHDWNHKAIDERMSTVDKETGEEIGKASYDASWFSQPDKFDYVNLERTTIESFPKYWFKYVFCKMLDLAMEYDGFANVRIVFWFDN